MTTTDLEKSQGHLCFKDGLEWYVFGGDLYRAPIGNAFDCDTHVRFGRWESTVEHARRYPGVFGFLPEAFLYPELVVELKHPKRSGRCQ
jgi:hypothetical protein